MLQERKENMDPIVSFLIWVIRLIEFMFFYGLSQKYIYHTSSTNGAFHLVSVMIALGVMGLLEDMNVVHQRRQRYKMKKYLENIKLEKDEVCEDESKSKSD